MGARLMPWVGAPLFNRLAASWRIEFVDDDVLASDEGCIVAMWHGRMLLLIRQYRERGVYVLVSRSGDGDVSERLLQRFGYGVVRGSKSRGGARSLREMLAVLRTNGVVVITPDGPRGPRHSMNDGVAWMARATGFPIIPVGVGADRAWRLRSWDRFTIPKPRARVAVSFGEPIVVPRDGGDQALQEASETLRKRLLEAERRAFAHLGVAPDW